MASKQKYRVLKGFNYGKNDTRVEAGKTISTLPQDVARNLERADAIEPAEADDAKGDD